MGDLGKPVEDGGLPAFSVFRENYGFVPRVFRAQAVLPRLLNAEAALANAILFRKTDLSRTEKELVALAEAAAAADPYGTALHYQTLRLLGMPAERLDSLLGNPDSEELPANLDTSLVRAWTAFVGTLAVGLNVRPDFPAPKVNRGALGAPPSCNLYRPKLDGSDDAAEFAFFREEFGIVPNLFRAQASWPEALQAEAQLISAVLIPEDVLSRLEKEKLILEVSGAANNEYAVALLSSLLEKRGVTAEECDQIAAGEGPAIDWGGFSEPQKVEATATAALAKFFVQLQIALGVEPDFEVRLISRASPQKNPNLLAEQSRPTAQDLVVDPDIQIVDAVRNGDVDAFEGLIDRHSRRVYRTLVGILGDPEEARDAMQDTFLKTFQHLGDFQGRSKVSTWIVSIATNTGIQRLRDRKPVESLDEAGDAQESFRPRQIRAWTDDPEQAYSKTERQRLVESSVMRLPAKYRVVLILRDIEQLSTEEAAAALGLAVPTLKSRLLRGRLMLRDALAPHFIARSSEVSH